jgi:hypothetical protein
MLIQAACQIRNCKWYLGIKNYDFYGDGQPRGDHYNYHCCAAYPEYPGIPAAITDGFDLHTDVYKDQVGQFTYEPKTLEDEKEEQEKQQEVIRRIEEEGN